MANWCFNEVCFIGGTKEQRNELFKKIELQLEKSCFPEASKNWIGNLSVACGIPIEEVEKENSKYRERAFIYNCRLSDDYIYLAIESAWHPVDEYLRDLFEANLPALEGMKYLYNAEEWGNDIWITNDVDGKIFTATYYYDDYEGALDSQYFETEDDLLKFVNSKEFKTAHNIQKDFNSFNEVEKYWINNDCEFKVSKIDIVYD